MAVRSTDRILVLQKIDDKKDTGLIDPKTLNGKNPLHLMMEEGTSVWSFRYEHGLVPGPLKGKYTQAKYALDVAKEYLATRNIRIVEVKE